MLGGLQGALGWYMVQSGLVDDPRVSQFRLTAHLGARVRDLRRDAVDRAVAAHAARMQRSAARRHARDCAASPSPCVALVFVMVLSGGLVAGIRAGFAYNTFPLMNGSVVPPEILLLEPAWKNFFWNMATVQFDHRAHRAGCSRSLVPLLAWRVRTAPARRGARVRGDALLLAMLAVQIALGIATLLLVVPLPLAALHQAGARRRCSRSRSTSRTRCADGAAARPAMRDASTPADCVRRDGR